MYDLVTVDKTFLPGTRRYDTYFLDLGRSSFDKSFICDLCRQKIMKNAERLYVVVVSDIY